MLLALAILLLAAIILLVWAWIIALNSNKPVTNQFWDWGSNASWEIDYEDDNHTERDTIV